MSREVGVDTVLGVVLVFLLVVADTGQLSVCPPQAAGIVGVVVGTLGTAGSIVDTAGMVGTGVGRHH